MDIKAFIREHEKTDSEFTYRIGQETIRARVLADASEVLAIEARAKRLIRVCAGNPSPDWQEYLPASEQVIRMAVWAEACLIEPKATFLDGLIMGKRCGLLLAELTAPIFERSATDTPEAEEEEIEAAKNG